MEINRTISGCDVAVSALSYGDGRVPAILSHCCLTDFKQRMNLYVTE